MTLMSPREPEAEMTNDPTGTEELHAPEAPDAPGTIEAPYTISARTRYAVVGVIAVLAFAAAYGVASAASRTAATAQTAAQAGQSTNGPGACGTCGDQASGACGDQASGACGGECGSSTSIEFEGSASLQGETQIISVDVSAGYFDPNVIRVKAGIPVEITFAEGSGCLAEVLFPQFDVREDLTQGGATVKLPALDPGTYGFSCGMEMVFGTLVVE